MTKEQFFYKYGCECKDPNCSSVVKEKCSAEFYRDLDSVFESFLKSGDLIWRTAAIQAIRTARFNFTVVSDINFSDHEREVNEIVENILKAQEKAIMEVGKNQAKEEEEFIERLKTYGDLFTPERIGQSVADFTRVNGELSSEGKAFVQKLISERTTLNPHPNYQAENEFIERLEKHSEYMTIEQLDELVANWVSLHGVFTYKNAEKIKQILSVVKKKGVQQDDERRTD